VWDEDGVEAVEEGEEGCLGNVVGGKGWRMSAGEGAGGSGEKDGGCGEFWEEGLLGCWLGRWDDGGTYGVLRMGGRLGLMVALLESGL
jgi:hypothetical protein